MCIGTAIGLVRGSRAAGLRFLAENAHRPPTTVQGWYFYNKTKKLQDDVGRVKQGRNGRSKAGIHSAWVGDI